MALLALEEEEEMFTGRYKLSVYRVTKTVFVLLGEET